MTTYPAAAHLTPAGLITHTTVTVKGQLDPDITVHHARTPDARIAITLDSIQMSLYNCQTAQGLLEAFVAARGHTVHLPAEIPAAAGPAQELAARTAVAIEWSRAPAYAAVAQSTLNKLKTATVHWVDLYTGPITWQLRDRSAILSMIDSLRRVHQTAIAVFADGEHHKADPAAVDYPAA